MDLDRAEQAEGALSLTLTDEEVKEVSGGYSRPADQLRALHDRGFVRAHRSKLTGRVVLERGHYDAVVAGHAAAANDPRGGRPRPKLRPATA